MTKGLAGLQFALCLLAAVFLSQAQAATKNTQLSELPADEVRIYQQGEISKGSLVGGGLLGTFVGFGTGHIVYGYYAKKGWIFTVGEFGTIAIATAGALSAFPHCFEGNSDKCGSGLGLSMLGVMGFIGLRVWEIIDVWTLPGDHNRTYRAIRTKVGPEVAPLVTTSERSSSPLYGLTLTLRF